MIVLALIPKKILELFEHDTWASHFASDDAQKSIIETVSNSKHPFHKKIANLFVLTSIVLVCVTGYIALRVYFDNTKTDKRQNAWDCAETIAKSIDPSQVNGFIKYRTNAPGYVATQELFTKIQECSHNVFRLYAVKFETNGLIYIFDTNRTAFYQPGELVPYEKKFSLIADSFIDCNYSRFNEQNGLFRWNYTCYYPVLDDEGKCLCFVCADASLNYFKEYMANFTMRVLLIMAGFFIVIISHTIWSIGTNMSYPISAIAACIDRFSDLSEDQGKLEENVKLIRSLDIHSQDEIQTLYDAICRMMLSQSEQLSDIRRLSESTAKMQDGLIITMADMVENRDSDTGEHVQKTAAYVKIIAEGLKKKGYYAQKITPKFISDAVRSAPLHDVGKINIPDNVLNKPGKLTDEEFAIMKTHTTAGKAILEKAISSVQGENYLKEARNMAAYHHERWDGKGYPEGLHGEVIPLSARIMAVADVFDALASPRVYKPAFPLEKALAILQEGSGTQFDPKCVEVFMDSLSEVKAVLKKYTGGSFVL